MTAGSDLVVGVDGGGSKTVAVVIDRRGCEIGRAVAGSSNYTIAGAVGAAEQVTRAVKQAMERAGESVPVRSLWVGLAGIDRPGAREELLPVLLPLAEEIWLSNDAELNFSALDGGTGVVLISGTGSIAIGRDATGATSRAGGWGNLLGDEGSGYDLGRHALQAAARAADGRGPTTSLLEAILVRWDLDQPMQMIARAHRATDKAEIAALGSVVFATARSGDPVSRKIVQDGANELALAALAVGKQLSFPERGLPLGLAGGLLTGEPEYRRRVLRIIRRARGVGQVAIVHDPALSAARNLLDLS